MDSNDDESLNTSGTTNELDSSQNSSKTSQESMDIGSNLEIAEILQQRKLTLMSLLKRMNDIEGKQLFRCFCRFNPH